MLYTKLGFSLIKVINMLMKFLQKKKKGWIWEQEKENINDISILTSLAYHVQEAF